jgi:hypothetical protein
MKTLLPWILAAVVFASLAFVPTPFALYKGETFLGYAPVWSGYAGLAFTEWPWAFWRSVVVVVLHIAITATVLLLARRMVGRRLTTRSS